MVCAGRAANGGWKACGSRGASTGNPGLIVGLVSTPPRPHSVCNCRFQCFSGFIGTIGKYQKRRFGGGRHVMCWAGWQRWLRGLWEGAFFARILYVFRLPSGSFAPSPAPQVYGIAGFSVSKASLNAAARLPDVEMPKFPFVEPFPPFWPFSPIFHQNVCGNGTGALPVLVLMCVQIQVLTYQTLNLDMFWKENLHGYVIQTF